MFPSDKMEGNNQKTRYKWNSTQTSLLMLDIRIKPTIITTSYGLTEFRDDKSRIGSRLMDDLVVEWVPIDAPDYRAHRR